jgi:hypothetical protein
MFAPLLPIAFPSIYGGDMPKRMARCTADLYAALMKLQKAVAAAGGALVLSDLYRSYDMQLQANLDYTSGKKKAFSPPPGGSMHEAGRAFDLDLSRIKTPGLAAFWALARAEGISPIIAKPDTGISEAWHFDCRGSHDRIYTYYRAGKGTNFTQAYTAMAASAIVSTGQRVDALGEDPRTGYLQSGLIRLGQEIGSMDGAIGPRSRKALAALGIAPDAPLDAQVAAMAQRLQQEFPREYFVSGVPMVETAQPEHLSV